MDVAIISAAAVIIAAIITNWLIRKNQIRFEERKLKEVYYIQYVKALSDNINIDDENEAIKILCYAHNNLLLVSSVDVVNKLQHYNGSKCNDKIRFQNNIFTNVRIGNIPIYKRRKTAKFSLKKSLTSIDSPLSNRILF